MVKPIRYAAGQDRIAQTKSIPAPVGGLNMRDSIAQMPETDASVMINWFPSTTSIGVRAGSTNWATGMASAVETVMPYIPPNGGSKLFAAAGANIFDITSGGSVGAAVVGSRASARNQYEQFVNAGGTYLVVVNGSDSPQVYNGTTWQAVTNASAPIAWTGGPGALTSLIQVFSWQGRLGFIEANSCRFHYLPSGVISGALSTFDLSSIFRGGGKLVAFADWNALTMTGPQDYAAFISSYGEVLVYQGIDPSLPGSWALVGRFRIGRPVGNRPVVKVGADVYVISADGLVPLSSMQMDERSQAGVESVTTKIQNGINNDVQTYSANFGWQCILHPIGNKLILNVPTASDATAYQYVKNTITGAWSKFTGWNAICWALYNDQLFYGAPGGIVVQADTGTNDNGQAINTQLTPAFSYFGDESQNKQFLMFRPIFYSDAPVSATYAFCTDFNVVNPTGSLSVPAAAGSQWNVALWNVSYWTSGLQARFAWQGGVGVGFCATLNLFTTSTAQNLQLYSIDYAWQAAEANFL